MHCIWLTPTHPRAISLSGYVIIMRAECVIELTPSFLPIPTTADPSPKEEGFNKYLRPS